MIVLPDPVGAPINTLDFYWYKLKNIWVCRGLKNLNLYRDWKTGFFSAYTGKGSKFNSSVNGVVSISMPKVSRFMSIS